MSHLKTVSFLWNEGRPRLQPHYGSVWCVRDSRVSYKLGELGLEFSSRQEAEGALKEKGDNFYIEEVQFVNSQ